METTSAVASALTLPHGREPRPFEALPVELISRIVCFLGPRDVVHLRLVSQLLRCVAYDPLIWKTIYANACLPRPPGPFPFQSPRFLEETLIRSERLAEFWTTQPIQTIASTQIRLRVEGPPLGRPRIIGGRWLVAFESYKQVVFYDIEKNSRHVLWEASGIITSWDACSVMSSSGLLVYVVVRQNSSGEVWQAPWKLLEFTVHEQSGQLSHSITLDVPTMRFWQSVCLFSDKAPFLYIVGRHLIFDTRTQAFYQFPEFGSQLDGVQTHQFQMTPRRVLLTRTHVVVISYRLHEAAMPSSTADSTLIQTFILPTDAGMVGNEIGLLRLSHETIISDRLANLVLIRDSTVDPITESTLLRFLRLHPEGDCLSFSCVDLTLPKSTSYTILPLSIKSMGVFMIQGGIYDPSMSPCGYLIDASDDGYVRGCCRCRNASPSGDDRPRSLWLTKFTVDATGDKCVATVGEASTPRWADGEDPQSFSMLSFDGVVGRFCYPKGEYNWRLHNFMDVLVVDVK